MPQDHPFTSASDVVVDVVSEIVPAGETRLVESAQFPQDMYWPISIDAAAADLDAFQLSFDPPVVTSESRGNDRAVVVGGFAELRAGSTFRVYATNRSDTPRALAFAIVGKQRLNRRAP